MTEPEIKALALWWKFWRDNSPSDRGFILRQIESFRTVLRMTQKDYTLKTFEDTLEKGI